MADASSFHHLGGGRKGLFLVLRYLFLAAASYLVIFDQHAATVLPAQGLMIALALASNVVLSFAPARLIFSWYVEAPVLIADSLWVSWVLHTTRTGGPEFFLLYFFVLSLAAVGENLALVVLGSTLVTAADVYFIAEGSLGTESHLLRIVFFYCVALFYGYVVREIKRERQRANKGITWARELEAKVAERTHELARLYQEAVAIGRLKSEFVATMSHELRSPLQIIIGYAEILLDAGVEEAERQQMTTRILEAGQDQLCLVNSLLDLGKIEGGKMPLDPRPVRLDDFMRHLERRPRALLAPEVALEWRVAQDLPLIETDPAKLTVVLDNLIGNAIKFTEAGAVTVTVSHIPDTAQVEFRIADTGSGIAEADLATIFEPFRQLDGSLTRRHGGVGLGLAIVRNYVALLGGEIAVHSTRGAGSSFIVTLPSCKSGQRLGEWFSGGSRQEAAAA